MAVDSVVTISLMPAGISAAVDFPSGLTPAASLLTAHEADDLGLLSLSCGGDHIKQTYILRVLLYF